MGIPLNQRFTVIPAVYILFRDGPKVLLLKRKNTSYYDGSFSLPSGHIDGNESALKAAIREGKEEVNANLMPNELKLVHVMHRRSDIPELHERIDFYFETTQQHPEIKNLEPEKCSELRWCLVEELPDNMTPEVRQAIEKSASDQTYSDFEFNNTL